MKLPSILAAAGLLVLCACSGNPTSTKTDSTTTTTASSSNSTTKAEDLASTAAAKVTVGGDDMATKVVYDAVKDEVIVEAIPFDDDIFEGRYQRTASLDKNGYKAYTSTTGFDTYVAYYDTSSTGSVRATVVNSGRYADHGYSGATFERSGSVALPTTTQRAYYNGNYVGLRTHGERGGMDTIQADAKVEIDFRTSFER